MITSDQRHHRSHANGGGNHQDLLGAHGGRDHLGGGRRASAGRQAGQLVRTLSSHRIYYEK